MFTQETRRFKELYRFIKPYQTILGVAAVFHSVCTVLALLMPLMLKVVIDKALSGTDLSLLYVLLAGMLLLCWTRAFFYYTCNYLTYYPIHRILLDLRVKLFKHLQSLSLRFYQEYRTGKLISNILTDVAALQAMFSTVIVGIASNMFAIIFTVIILVVLSPTLSLICLVVLPLVYLVFSHFRKVLRILSMRLREHMSEVSANLAEVINGVKVVKSFGKERFENRNFMERMKPTFDMSLSLSMRGFMQSIVMDQISNYTLISVLGFGGYLVSQGKMTLGELVAFYTYMNMLFGPLMMLTNFAPTISEGAVSAERLSMLMSSVPEIKEREHAIHLYPAKGQVNFESVSFGYAPDRMVLHDFTLAVEPGLKIALVGPSGSGKSTIASLLMRFFDVTSGRILLDGIDIRDLALDSLHHNIGIVLQESFLFSGTIEENIRYGKQETTFEEIIAAAKMANAYDFIRELPLGFKSEVGENGVSLSGGQKQRIAIARTVLHNPAVLILDEATSALDTVSESVVQQALDKLMANRTTIIIAHRLSTVRNADLIIVLKDGRIAQRGRHEELLDQDGPYRQLYAMQLKSSNEQNSPNYANSHVDLGEDPEE
ncbi:MAG: ABC transporter ATP-binding protein/permease [Victivallales bacterium]|jgi:subfamily B ATP-binding cassette protein MsbA|nr:ABC transporter ATP-binding protein/permease [Victivallales bacterium]